MIRRRRATVRAAGFATLTAIGLIVVVAVALAGLTALLANDVKRSLRTADDAQLRQLLVAGEIAAHASIEGRLPNDGVLPLPRELADAGCAVRVKRTDAQDADVVTFQVTATAGHDRSAAQSLRYARSGTGWTLASADAL